MPVIVTVTTVFTVAVCLNTLIKIYYKLAKHRTIAIGIICK